MTILVLILLGLPCAFVVLCLLGGPKASPALRITDAELDQAFAQPEDMMGWSLEQIEAHIGPCDGRGYGDFGDTDAYWQSEKLRFEAWFKKNGCISITRHERS
ncbi:MAG TPA: hypothetical protein VLC08_13735 [Chitinolyticbacter sp.]|nr:hypothetical protein [Chitinolyticbacter sp.]